MTTAESLSTVVTSPWPDLDIPDVPLTAFLLAAAARRAEHPAVVDAATGRSLSYGEFAHQIDRAAAGFAAQGLAKGDVVAILSPNSPEWLVACHGAIAAGGVVSGLNPLWSADEVAAQIHDSAARFLVTTGALAANARAAAEKAGVGTRLVLLDGPSVATIDGTLGLTDLLACTDPAPDVAIDPAVDLALLPYSSGTTGLPKGVMLTHRACIANVLQTVAALRIGPEDRTLAVAPFSHAVGWGVVANCALHVGATIVTLPRFEPHAFLGAIQEHRVTQTVVVPPVVLALARHPAVADYDLSSLKWLACGAAPLGADLQRECMARLGIPVVQGFGMTEAVATIAADPIDTDVVAGSCGQLLPGVQARIDPMTGELWIRSAAQMAGYLGNPDATAATVDAEGWLHTGDVAHFDENGSLFVVDRIKELIKVKAYQVAPAELEAVLRGHPAVADAAVIGIPDERSGEVPKAFVVARAPVSADELTAHVAAHVAPYKQVREIAFIDAVPVSPSGKILRRLLRGR
jgi:acyl-CoA synthetase (AMP-forming)/AMP-acid ligase II